MKKILRMLGILPPKVASDVGTYAVAVQMFKGDIHTITLSWRANSTRENAIRECLEYATNAKPGFEVDQYLVDKIS